MDGNISPPVLEMVRESGALTWHDNFHLFISHSCSVQRPSHPSSISLTFAIHLYNHSRVSCSIPLPIPQPNILPTATAVARVILSEMPTWRKIECDVEKGVRSHVRLPAGLFRRRNMGSNYSAQSQSESDLHHSYLRISSESFATMHDVLPATERYYKVGRKCFRKASERVAAIVGCLK